MERAKEEIRAGRPLEAQLLLDAVLSLPASLSPSADPVETQRLITERLDRERAYWSIRVAGAEEGAGR